MQFEYCFRIMISDHMHARVVQVRVKSHCACEHGQTSKATVDVATTDVKKQRGERDDEKDDVTYNPSLPISPPL